MKRSRRTVPDPCRVGLAGAIKRGDHLVISANVSLLYSPSPLRASRMFDADMVRIARP